MFRPSSAQPIHGQFYGDRTGSIEDPFVHVWHLAAHKEEVSKAEMRKRSEKSVKETQEMKESGD